MGRGTWSWIVPDGLREIAKPLIPPSRVLTGYRRLNHRCERHARNYLAFLGLAAAICCYKRLLRLTT